MEKDYRISLIHDIEMELANKLPMDQVALISNIVTKCLSDYEVTQRCTAITIRDDINIKLLKRYSGCLKIEGKSSGTIYQYIRHLRKLTEVICKPYTEMGIYDIRFFLASEQERGLSSRTVDNIRSSLSAFFQWMTNEEIIAKNPIAAISQIQYPKEIKQPFSDVEIDSLRSSCKSLKERAILEMLLSTGVRVSELTNMKIEDVNFDNLSIHVVHGKGAKDRITYTTPVGVKYLKQYLDKRTDNVANLFCNNKNKPLKAGGIRFILNTVAKRANVKDIYPHKFRRTFASGLAKRGMKIEEIQRLLGHSSLNTTMRYVYINDDNVHSSYNKHII